MPPRKRRGRHVAVMKDKWKLKKWYTVLAPSYFGNIEIGSIPASDPSLLYGRVVETTLYNITGDFSQIHILLYFQIIDVKGEIAYTRFKGHDLTRDYLKSLIRRGTSFVDGIFKVTTKDGYVLRVYPSAFTRYRIQTSKDVAIRKVMKEIVEAKAQALTFEEFVREAVLGKIASEIYNKAKKIVPLRRVEVRKSKLLRAPETPIVHEEVSAEEEKTEEKIEIQEGQ
ncbi:MAG: 30S ribosomal protein S3ae [Candidatus Asgardarchaeia archaeon]|nr:30S ribosomal protein S3ae [Candidatus Odinarchaeota archaeon]